MACVASFRPFPCHAPGPAMPRSLSQHSLQAFRLTILQGSVSAAADALGRSQPAVSRLLKELEQDVGFRLFDRVRGRLQPTGEGLLLFQEVERSFVGLDRIASIAGEIRTGRRGTIAIGCLPAAAASVIPGVLAELTARHPDVSVLLHILPSVTIVQMVLTQGCDLGFVSMAAITPGLRVERQYRTPCMCITPAGHRLARRRHVGPQDLAGEALVMLSPATRIGRQVEAAIERHGIDKLTRVETHLTPLVSALVLEGIGIGVVDSMTARSHVARGGAAVPFEPVLHFEFGVVRRDGSEPSGMQARFIEICDRQLAAVPGIETIRPPAPP